MDRDAEPPAFRSNLLPGSVTTTTSSGYASPPPSPRLRHCAKSIVQASLLLRLPVEVRTLILVAAFGDRTIHADLDLVDTPAGGAPALALPQTPARPSTPPDGPGGGGSGDGGGVGTARRQQERDLVDLASADLEWKPTGHLCHRRCFDARRAPAALPAPLFVVDRDRCFTGGAALCSLPAHGLASCRIGALGWLLACRQAYVEGLEVLYRRNTFRLNESFALENMARIIAPASCAASHIARLSLSLTMGRPRVASDRIAYPRPRDAVQHLPSLFSLLPETFPGLSRLHLVLAGEMWPETQLSVYCSPSAVLHARVEGMLAELEGMMARFGALQHCEVAFDSSIYFPWLQVDRDLEIDFKDYADFEQCPYTVWRPLAADTQNVRRVPTDRRQLSGYWVCLDAWDAIPWSVMTDLYGTGPW